MLLQFQMSFSYSSHTFSYSWVFSTQSQLFFTHFWNLPVHPIHFSYTILWNVLSFCKFCSTSLKYKFVTQVCKVCCSNPVGVLYSKHVQNTRLSHGVSAHMFEIQPREAVCCTNSYWDYTDLEMALQSSWWRKFRAAWSKC